MTIKIAILLAAAVSISGCVTSYSPDALSDVKRNDCVIITETSTYDVNGRTEGLVAGTYRAEKEDENGVFFRGPSRPVFYNGDVDSPRFFIKAGGIWLPRQAIKKPRLYSYFEREAHSVDDINSYSTQVAINSAGNGTGTGPSVLGSAIGLGIVNAIIQSDVGTIYPWKEIHDVDFISKISNVQSCPANMDDTAP